MLSAKRCVQAVAMRCFSTTAPTFKNINLAVDDKTGIATLEFDRPPVHSLNTPLLQEISSTLTDLTKNKSRGLILTSVCKIEFKSKN